MNSGLVKRILGKSPARIPLNSAGVLDYVRRESKTRRIAHGHRTDRDRPAQASLRAFLRDELRPGLRPDLQLGQGLRGRRLRLGRVRGRGGPSLQRRDDGDGLARHEGISRAAHLPQGARRARGLRPRSRRLPGQPDGQGRDRAGALGPQGEEGGLAAPQALRRRPDRDRGRRELRHRGFPARPRRPHRPVPRPGL